jgi:hypothetical protein
VLAVEITDTAYGCGLCPAVAEAADRLAAGIVEEIVGG